MIGTELRKALQAFERVVQDMQQAHSGDLRANEREIIALRPKFIKALDMLVGAAKMEPGLRADQAKLDAFLGQVREIRTTISGLQVQWGRGRMHDDPQGYLETCRPVGRLNMDFLQWAGKEL